MMISFGAPLSGVANASESTRVIDDVAGCFESRFVDAPLGRWRFLRWVRRHAVASYGLDAGLLN